MAMSILMCAFVTFYVFFTVEAKRATVRDDELYPKGSVGEAETQTHTHGVDEVRYGLHEMQSKEADTHYEEQAHVVNHASLAESGDHNNNNNNNNNNSSSNSRGSSQVSGTSDEVNDHTQAVNLDEHVTQEVNNASNRRTILTVEDKPVFCWGNKECEKKKKAEEEKKQRIRDADKEREKILQDLGGWGDCNRQDCEKCFSIRSLKHEGLKAHAQSDASETGWGSRNYKVHYCLRAQKLKGRLDKGNLTNSLKCRCTTGRFSMTTASGFSDRGVCEAFKEKGYKTTEQLFMEA